MKSIKQISPDIRLVASPEQESYESVYGRIDDSEQREAIFKAIDDGGMWFVLAEVKCRCCGNWTDADSIGMIIGDPFSEEDNCYLPDLIRSAELKLEELAKA